MSLSGCSYFWFLYDMFVHKNLHVLKLMLYQGYELFICVSIFIICLLKLLHWRCLYSNCNSPRSIAAYVMWMIIHFTNYCLFLNLVLNLRNWSRVDNFEYFLIFLFHILVTLFMLVHCLTYLLCLFSLLFLFYDPH